MRKALLAITAIGVLFCRSGVLAQEGPQGIIEKAIESQGGRDKLSKIQGVRVKAKGSVEVLGMSATFTQETVNVISGKIKDGMEVEFMNNKVNIITVFNGTKGWVVANGQKQELPEKALEATKDAIHVGRVSRLVDLKKPEYQLSSLPETKVGGKPAVGVKVSSKGEKDVKLYFDKDSGILAKIESRALDPMSGQEVSQEKILSDYRDVNGLKVAHKVTVQNDGKKFMEAEVLDVKFLDKIEDSEFAEPQPSEKSANEVLPFAVVAL